MKRFCAMKNVLTLCVLSVIVILAESKCPVGWVEADGSCWFVSRDHETASWGTASSECQAFKGELAVIPDMQVQNTISALLGRRKEESYWIDGTDMIAEGAWIWASSREPITFTNYAHGSRPAHDSKDKNCLIINKKNGYTWEAADCDHASNFICQTPLINSGGAPVVG